MQEQQFSSYQLRTISLRYSTFRNTKYDFEPKIFEVGFGWQIPEQSKESISIELLVFITSPDEGISKEDFFISVAMRGDFSIKVSEEPPEPAIEAFSKVNGPAIIYPYIRQHIRNLTLEAGFKPPILIPVINFNKFPEMLGKTEEKNKSNSK